MFNKILLLFMFTSFISIGQTSEHFIVDFDHRIKYKKVLLKEDLHQLIVRRNDKNSFANVAQFIIRFASKTCHSKPFQLVYLTDVELFNEVDIMKNRIKGDVIVNISCHFRAP